MSVSEKSHLNLSDYIQFLLKKNLNLQLFITTNVSLTNIYSTPLALNLGRYMSHCCQHNWHNNLLKSQRSSHTDTVDLLLQMTFWRLERCFYSIYILGWLDFPLFSRIISELMAKVVYPCQ